MNNHKILTEIRQPLRPLGPEGRNVNPELRSKNLRVALSSGAILSKTIT